ncbi:MAG: O-antigen ligase family protein [Oscillospiraceae bacterium]|nr:O-antigen ligase family protein [Oscillospiraceae bacterium]
MLIIEKKDISAYLVLTIFTMRSLCLTLNNTVGSNLPRLLIPIILIFLINADVRENGISTHSLLVILFYIVQIPATILISKDYISYYSYAIEAIGISYLCSRYIREDMMRAIRIIRNYMTFLVIVNIIIQMLFPAGIDVGSSTGGMYLFGIRIEFSAPYVLMIFCSLLYDALLYDRLYLSRQSIVMFVICFISLMAQQISTGIVAMSLIFVFIVLAYTFKGFKRINYWILLLIALVVTISIVVLQTSNFDFILNILGENETFSNRIYIWGSAIQQFLQRPIWGHGITQRGAFEITYASGWVGDTRPAHNQYLHVLYEGGIVAFIAYISFFLNLGNKIKKVDESHITFLIKMVVFVFCVMSITEIQSQRVWIFFAIAISFNVLEVLSRQDERGLLTEMEE